MGVAVLRSDDAAVWGRFLGRGSVQSDRAENFQTAQTVFEHQSAQNRGSQYSKSLHRSVPSSHPKHATESAVPQLAKNTHEIRERLHNALKQRIGIGKPVSVKVVARATGLTERTIENAMSGETMPRGDTLMALVDFFDASFANEIFAGSTFMIVKLSDERAAHAARMINEGVAALAALGGQR